MNAPGSRRLNLVDGMLFIAATSAGLAIARVPLFRALRNLHDLRSRGMAASFLFSLSPIAACWTTALLASHLRRPRPALSRLWRRPGWVGCVGTAIGSAVTAMCYLVDVVNGGHYTEFDDLLAICNGYIIAATWGILALSGRWRPEPAAIDRFGRILGGYWLSQVIVLLFAI